MPQHQLRELYGPLNSLARTGREVYLAFGTKHRPYIDYFGNNPPPTEEDLKTWQLWIKIVFIPRNIQMQELIITKADLLIEPEMPESLNDFSKHFSIIPNPRDELLDYSHEHLEA